MNDAAANVQKNAKNRLKFGLTDKKNMVGYIFVLPFIIGLCTIFLPAIVQSMIYSFHEVQINFSRVNTHFVGWKNFSDAFLVDTGYRVVLLNTLRGMVIDTLIILFFSFFIANVLNQKFKGRGLARTLFFLPVILSTGIIAAADSNSMLIDLFGSGTNTGNVVASAFDNGGFASFFDLKELLVSSNINSSITGIILYAIDNTYKVVNSSGVQILIFLSALQTISPSVFEAAKVEGATKWEAFWKITFPMLTPMILVNIIYTIVDSFTNPSFGLLEYIQQQAFTLNKMGYASSISWIYFLIVLVELGLIWGVLAKRIQYFD